MDENGTRAVGFQHHRSQPIARIATGAQVQKLGD
jgi:hypothetical protein